MTRSTVETTGEPTGEPAGEAPRRSDLTIGVVHHRVPAVLRECVARLVRYAGGARLVVVDTSPSAETAAWLDLVAAGGTPVAYLPCPNHSLAGAVNRFLREVETPFAAHMNADVYLGAGALDALLAPFADARVGMVGPTCVTPAGRPQPMGPLYRRHHLRLALSRRPVVPAPWLAGCLQLVRCAAVAAVGGMDASYRFYNEDIEWCGRLRRGSWKVLLHEQRVVHLGGASTPPRAAFRIEGYRGGMVLSRRTRSPLYRRLHRAAVRFEAGVRRFDPDPEARLAYRAIARMFALERYDVSPFGATLDRIAPDFERAVGAPAAREGVGPSDSGSLRTGS